MRDLNKIKYLGLLLITIIFSSIDSKGQEQKEGSVGIGTVKPDQSAILDLSSKSKGLLLPRLTLTERANIKNPATGLMVYQTNLLKGLYVYNGQEWSLVNNNQAQLTTNSTGVWSLFGNTDTNSDENFLGTLDENNLVFKVNNEKSGLIDLKRGLTLFGYKAGYLSNGYNSVVLGAMSMQKANNSGNNVAIGYQTLFSTESGDHNVAIGSGVLAASVNNEKNTAVGSLAGYKSTGSGNVFLGFQAGYFESGSNKLHISNDANKVPLIYGDFENARVGINTTNLNNIFNINGINNHSSGLRFERLTSESPTVGSNRKVLTVNNSGDVVLANDYFESTTTYWNASGNNIINNNAGTVDIKGSMNVGNAISAKSLRIGVDGLIMSSLTASTGQFLTVDNAGKVVLSSLPATGPSGSTDWSNNGTDVSNTNSGIVGINNGLRLNYLNSNSDVATSNSKVLSVDENGNIILVEDQSGNITLSGDGTGLWTLDGNGKIINNNSSNVKLDGNLEVEQTIFSRGVFTRGIAVGDFNLKFTTMNASSPVGTSNGKVLSLNESGEIILVPDLVGSGTTETITVPSTGGSSPWTSNGGVIYSHSDDKVMIGHGINSLPEGFRLYVKDGILAERVKVAVANSEKWADYVFEDDYNLMPLEQVEGFIKENKHLPNVPSAEKIAENGLDLAEITAKQMEKIEELTLYLIEYKKQLDAANERIEALEKQNLK